MTVSLVMAIVLIAAVIAWARTRRAYRRAPDPEDYAPPVPKKQGAEIWISLVEASKRDRIVNEIQAWGEIIPTTSPTDILVQTDDARTAEREIRAALARLGVQATVSVTKAADGDVN